MTPELKRALAALKVEFTAEIADKRITRLGLQNCRRKNNKPTGPWSEHSWPNAVDVHIKADPTGKFTGDRIAAWMEANTDLWEEVFWQIEHHFDHVHGTANPRRNPDNKRIPPCESGVPDPEVAILSETTVTIVHTVLSDDSEERDNDMWQYLTVGEDLVRHAWNQGWLEPKTQVTLDFFIAAVRSGDINEPTWPDFRNFRVAVTNGIAMSAGNDGSA